MIEDGAREHETVGKSLRGGTRQSYSGGFAGREVKALQAFTEKILPGRWNDARQPNEKELKATSVLRLPLTEVSAKNARRSSEDDARTTYCRLGRCDSPVTRTGHADPGREVRPAIPTPAYAASTSGEP